MKSTLTSHSEIYESWRARDAEAKEMAQMDNSKER